MSEMDRNIDTIVLFGSFAARYRRWCLTQAKERLIQAFDTKRLILTCIILPLWHIMYDSCQSPSCILFFLIIFIYLYSIFSYYLNIFMQIY